MKTEALRGKSLCLLIDRSASMQTKEENGTTRLEIAKKKAHEIINNTGKDKIMIASFAEKSEVLCELSDDKWRLRKAVDSIDASDTSTKIRDAILVAYSLKSSVPDIELIIISDGNISDLEDIGVKTPDITFAQVGKSKNNVGISSFSIREPQEGKLDRQCFLILHNENSTPVETTLSLYWDDTILGIVEIIIPPEQDKNFVFAIPDLGSGILKAEIDIEDALDVDNIAILSVKPPPMIRILLVSESDSVSSYFIRKCFSLDQRVELSAIPPSEYMVTDDYDLTIFEGFAPEVIPGGGIVYINATPRVPDSLQIDAIENPIILASDIKHPLMRFLNPSNIIIKKSLRIKVPEGNKDLLSTEGGSLIADISRGNQQILFIGFDIAETNWPLHLSFPLFIQNLLRWVETQGIEGDTSITTGNPIKILPNLDIEFAEITKPDGSTDKIQLDPIRPVYFGNTEKAGIYTLKSGEITEQYAVNLLDRNETSITPSESINISRAEIQAEKENIVKNKELWRFFIIIALLFLMLEWYIYSRRAWL